MTDIHNMYTKCLIKKSPNVAKNLSCVAGNSKMNLFNICKRIVPVYYHNTY